jgi:hypothetical protein
VRKVLYQEEHDTGWDVEMPRRRSLGVQTVSEQTEHLYGLRREDKRKEADRRRNSDARKC